MRHWVAAARPKTLTAGAIPVFVGSALAASQKHFNFWAFAAALVGALAIQVGTNYVNDAADHLKGADTEERLGPARMAAQGLLTPRALFIGAGIAFLVSFIAGLYLVYIAGWPLLAIGLISILCGIAYTAGPFPLAYWGLGDLFVFIFFGLVAVCGTYYVHTLELNSLSLAIAALVGLQGVTLIAVNNTRDIPTDLKAQKKTLSVRLGDRGARLYTTCTILLPFVFLPLVVFFYKLSFLVLLPLLALPLAFLNMRALFVVQGKGFNPLLARSALLQLLFGALLSLGFWLGAV